MPTPAPTNPFKVVVRGRCRACDVDWDIKRNRLELHCWFCGRMGEPGHVAYSYPAPLENYRSVADVAWGRIVETAKMA